MLTPSRHQAGCCCHQHSLSTQTTPQGATAHEISFERCVVAGKLTWHLHLVKDCQQFQHSRQAHVSSAWKQQQHGFTLLLQLNHNQLRQCISPTERLSSAEGDPWSRTLSLMCCCCCLLLWLGCLIHQIHQPPEIDSRVIAETHFTGSAGAVAVLTLLGQIQML